ncbi:MAG: hypothetical protein J7L38_07150 [Thermoproteales archaeon]|nr:hypothetical protein [Thermoproteales archaeon]
MSKTTMFRKIGGIPCLFLENRGTLGFTIVIVPGLRINLREVFRIAFYLLESFKGIKVCIPLFFLEKWRNLGEFLEKIGYFSLELRKILEKISGEKIVIGFSVGCVVTLNACKRVQHIRYLILACGGSIIVNLLSNKDFIAFFGLHRGNIATEAREKRIENLLMEYDPYYTKFVELHDKVVHLILCEKGLFSKTSTMVIGKNMEKIGKKINLSVKMHYSSDYLKLPFVISKILTEIINEKYIMEKLS